MLWPLFFTLFHYFVVAYISLNEFLTECFMMIVFPSNSYVVPFLYQFELLSPVLDAFEVDTQAVIVLFSIQASVVLLNEMMSALSYSLFTSSRSQSESDKEESLSLTATELSHQNRTSASTFGTTRRFMSNILPFGGSRK